MGNSADWQDLKYKQVFDDETRGLERRRKADPACKIDDLEGILKNLYIINGTDQGGSLQETIMAATIAAYERFIINWKAEAGN